MFVPYVQMRYLGASGLNLLQSTFALSKSTKDKFFGGSTPPPPPPGSLRVKCSIDSFGIL